MNNKNRGILFIGNYPINVLNGAARIRIWNIKRVLKPDYSIIGFIAERLKGYYKLFRNNEIKNIKYVYVEPSASTANPVDLIFLIFRPILLVIYHVMNPAIHNFPVHFSGHNSLILIRYTCQYPQPVLGTYPGIELR